MVMFIHIAAVFYIALNLIALYSRACNNEYDEQFWLCEINKYIYFSGLASALILLLMKFNSNN